MIRSPGVAKTLWCPFARVEEGNRIYEDYDDSRAGTAWLLGCECIAEMCMAWRWVDDNRGYCGLVSKPE
jgi:hypothetical protein